MRILIPLTLLIFMAIGQKVAMAAVENWHLKQYSKVQGQQEIWLSPSAIKLINEDKQVAILINLHEVSIWNDAKKLIYHEPLSKWTGLHRFSREDAIFSQFGKIVKGRVQNGLLLGLPTRKIFYPTEKSVTAREPELRATNWVSSAFDLPPELSRAIQYYYALPADEGFPLQCYLYSKTQGNGYRLKTISLERIADSNERFKPPMNFHEAKNEEQILFGNEKTEFIKTMTSK